ncbi:putative disease resistance RPP13-like protein 1 [Phragmites australis]|uniref:putative disease resistance RPP13-like protein 1 n=1 Tax=Phragmites australis TaxID=29695 RepID=UPI002D788689|nr:putative disease resistance RPP13-like protein 1 [Phragmites australis]
MVGPGLTVGGWFAGAVIANFVAKVRSIMEDHHALQAEAGDMMYSVEAALPRIKILVEVTERRAISNGSFAAWLQQFKDVVSEAEDLLDDFETKRIQEKLLRKGSKVGSAASFALKYVRNLLLSDTDLQRLKDVLKKLNKIISEIGGTGFHSMLDLADAEEGVTMRILPPTRPVVIGRDEEKQQLLSMMFPAAPPPRDGAESSKQFSVIPVVGAAGVGKTTLAQVIYNDPNVKEAFALRGWVLASRRSRNSGDFAKDIIDSFGTEQQDNLQTMPGPSECDLLSAIENKRFFLVLDDVQVNLHEMWASLRSALPGAANGSVVLLTTRSEEVANSFGTTAHVTLEQLPFPVLCRVFEHHAFGKKKNASLELIGKKIVQNLHGLPLLAEAIGRLLRQKLDEGHWQKISRSHWWHFAEDDDSQNVALPSVAIMCEYLSDHLRKCLCYCSIFPSGYLFEKNMLIHMWIASFMQQHDGIGMEEKEKEWFDELSNRSFFQPTIWKNKYVIPDIIREPIYSIAQKECHAATDSGEPKRSLQLYRHLAIDIPDLNVHLDLGKANKLRTILFFDGRKTIKPHEALANILSHPSALRVLDFSYYEAKLGKAHDFINKFHHLRFLDLSFTEITVLPDSICKLHLLQVLGLRGCQFKELPRAMNELISLRFLYAEARTVSLIYKIGQLTNLQGLEEFPIGKTEGHKITELKDLNEVSGRLCICNLEEVTCTDIEGGEPELFRKRHLKKLVLKWGSAAGTSTIASDGCMRTLAGLKPNANLEELRIQCYMGVGFPAWMADEQYFTKLQHIHLIECEQLITLPPLGQLPSLVILVLQGLSVVEKIGSEFYGTNYRVFPSLEELKFLDMPNWREWSDIEELQDSRALPFPHLRKVQIRNCKVLSGMPLCCLQASLEELDLSGCNEIFACKPSSLEGLKCLLCLKIHHCLGRIYLPCDLLGSLEVLNLQTCKVYFHGGRGQIIKLRRILTSDCHELNLDEFKAIRKEQLVLEVLLSKGVHYLPSCFVNNWNSEASIS